MKSNGEKMDRFNRKRNKIYKSIILFIIIFLVFNACLFSSYNIKSENNHYWPRFGHDNKNTGLSDVKATDNRGKLSWKFKTDNKITSSPTIDRDGNIYIGSHNGYLYSLNGNGKKNWKFDAKGEISSSPTIDSEDNVYFGTNMGYVYCVDKDGKEVWSYRNPQGAFMVGSPIVNGDKLYLKSTNPNNLYSFNLDGNENWRENQDGGFSFSSPSLDHEGRIYCSSTISISLHSYTRDGKLNWVFEGLCDNAGSVGATTPAIDINNNIYVGLGEKLYVISQSGEEKWNYTVGSITYSSPSFGPEGNVYIGSEDGMFAFSSSGDLIWQIDIGEVYSSPAISSDGVIFLGSKDNHIYSINRNGSVNWRYKTNGEIYSSPAIGPDGIAYIGSDDGNFYAIGSKNDDSPGYSIHISILTLATLSIIYKYRKVRNKKNY